MADRRRPGGPMPPISKAFELISLATVAKSAADAKRLCYLRPDDGITMNRDRLLADAKARRWRWPKGIQRPPARRPRSACPAPPRRWRSIWPCTPSPARQGHGARPGRGRCPGRGALRRRRRRRPAAGRGGSALERRSFMRLIRHPASIARIEHMLETGKPCATDARLPPRAWPCGSSDCWPASRVTALPGCEDATPELIDSVLEQGRDWPRASWRPEPLRRRGGLQLRERRRAHAARVPSGLRGLPRRWLDRRAAARVGRPGPAEAGQHLAPRRCSPAPTSPSPPIPA